MTAKLNGTTLHFAPCPDRGGTGNLNRVRSWWGTDGFAYPDINSARERLSTLLSDEQNKARKEEA